MRIAEWSARQIGCGVALHPLRVAQRWDAARRVESMRQWVRRVFVVASTVLVVLALVAELGRAEKPRSHPDLGPNVLVFDSSMASSAIQQQIDKIYAVEQHSEFGSARSALLFLPGEYRVDVPVGFYTQVLGLGVTPDAVHIVGNVHSDASLPQNNATCTFWRAAEGISVTPTGGTMRWAVSQAVPFRRM